MKTKLILVGGFLGAGKTTLLSEIARQLQQQKIGLITNDQASGLVDTAFLAASASEVREVSGSCFCCNFNGLASAIFSLQEQLGEGGLIVAEPVGSCTDLSATILQPLKEQFPDQLEIAPLTVLVDPRRLAGILLGAPSDLHPSAQYIIEKQLEEADVIFLNKADLLEAAEAQQLTQRAAKRWPHAIVMAGSALSGAGLAAWLDCVFTQAGAGTHLAAVDYDLYAAGEAALGWLNARFSLQGQEVAWDVLAANLLRTLSEAFESRKTAVGHVKLLLENGKAFTIGNLTGNSDTLRLQNSAGSSDAALLTVNARVEISPAHLETLVLAALQAVCGDTVRYSVVEMNCLTPGRPNPTYRYNRVV